MTPLLRWSLARLAVCSLWQIAGCATPRASAADAAAALPSAGGRVLEAPSAAMPASAAVPDPRAAASRSGLPHDRQTASQDEAAKRYALATQPRREIDNSAVNPARASAGAQIGSEVGATVLLPRGTADLKVTETRASLRRKDRSPQSRHELLWAQGSPISTLNFTLPKDVPAGAYLLVTVRTSGALTRTVQTPLSVG